MGLDEIAHRLGTGRYRLTRKIGRGSSGTVYRAHDRLDRVDVALKILDQGFSPAAASSEARDDREARDGAHLAAREFRLLASYRHPGVVTVFDLGWTAGGHPWFTMELLGGPVAAARSTPSTRSTSVPTDLAQWAGQRKQGELAPLLGQVLVALHSLHSRGVVHGDLKPSNILVVDHPDGTSTAKIVDFGLASTATDSRRSLTDRDRPDTVSGTLAYLAPELLDCAPPTARSDLYALGCIAYELLTGKPPLAGESASTTLMRRAAGEEPSFDGVPEAWIDVLRSVLTTDPRSRPASARQYALRLASRFGCPLPDDARGPDLDVGLCGRESLLQQLDGLTRATPSSPTTATHPKITRPTRPAVILLRGATGVGKSRLLRELEIRELLDAHAVRRETVRACARPGAPVERLLRYLELARSKGAEQPANHSPADESPADAAPPLMESIDPTAREASRDRLARTLQRALVSTGGTRPLVLLLDDVTRADATTFDLLLDTMRWLLADDAASLPTATLVLAAADDTADDAARLSELEAAGHGRADFTSLTISGLDVEGMTRYLERALGAVDPVTGLPVTDQATAGTGAAVASDATTPDTVENLASFAAHLHREVGGNVLFLEEHLLALAARGALRRSTESDAWLLDASGLSESVDVPSAIEPVIERRLERLSPLAADVLAWCAVLDAPTSPRRLASLLERGSESTVTHSDLLNSIDTLIRDGLLVHEGARYSLAHGAVQRIAYARLTDDTRRVRHDEIARRIISAGDDDDRDELARHLYHSSTPERALSLLVEAGARALRSGAVREADTSLTRALQLTQAQGLAASQQKRFSILIALDQVAALLEDHERQERLQQDLETLAASIDSPEVRRQVALRRAAALESRGDKRSALDVLDRAATACADDAGATGGVLTRAGLLRLYLGESERGFKDLSRALVLARNADDRRLEAESLQLLGLGHYLRGDSAEGARQMQRALALRRELNEPQHIGALESNLGLIHLDQGRLRDAKEHFEASLRAFRELGLRRGEAINCVNLGLVYSAMGRFERALELTTRALSLRRQLGDRRGEGADLGNLGEIWMFLGRDERALPLVENALCIAEEFENRSSADANRTRLARIRLNRGDVDAAPRRARGGGRQESRYRKRRKRCDRAQRGRGRICPRASTHTPRCWPAGRCTQACRASGCLIRERGSPRANRTRPHLRRADRTSARPRRQSPRALIGRGLPYRGRSGVAGGGAGGVVGALSQHRSRPRGRPRRRHTRDSRARCRRSAPPCVRSFARTRRRHLRR